MMEVIALALNLSPNCYKMKTRARHIAELRFICALFLRMHFPYITLQQIATLFGGLDHSSIISGLARANNLIYTGDLRFIKKYNTALKSVNLWLRKGI
jgi:chromosomal replication initiation ATPase DnaA